MPRLRPGKRLVSDDRERAAAPRVLYPGPGERRVEIIAAVHVDGPGFELAADAPGGVLVLGPDRRGEAIGGIIHEPDRLIVVGHLHDADHRPETLLAHDRHLVVDLR